MASERIFSAINKSLLDEVTYSQQINTWRQTYQNGRYRYTVNILIELVSIIISEKSEQDTVLTSKSDCELLARMTMSESSTNLTHEERIDIVRTHFTNKGYRVHSGLQFGVELVLYSDVPEKVHSDFCVHVPQDNNGKLDWGMIQTLVRSMPGLKKTLIVAHVKEKKSDGSSSYSDGSGDDTQQQQSVKQRYVVHELAISSEHAPFRHKNIPKGVGTQIKPQQKNNE